MRAIYFPVAYCLPLPYTISKNELAIRAWFSFYYCGARSQTKPKTEGKAL
jgi:hypothetical protein